MLQIESVLLDRSSHDIIDDASASTTKGGAMKVGAKYANRYIMGVL